MHILDCPSAAKSWCLTLCDPWTVARQAPLSMGFSRQEYWSGLPFLLQVICPTQGANLHLLHWQADSLPLSRRGSPRILNTQAPNLARPQVEPEGNWYPPCAGQRPPSVSGSSPGHSGWRMRRKAIAPAARLSPVNSLVHRAVGAWMNTVTFPVTGANDSWAPAPSGLPVETKC